MDANNDNNKEAVSQNKRVMDESQKEAAIELVNLLTLLSIERRKETAEKITKLEAEKKQIAQELELIRKRILQRQTIRESRKISKYVASLQEIIFAQWRNISNVTKTCRDKRSAANSMKKYNAKLRNLWMQMATINKELKAKIDDLTPARVEIVEMLVKYNGDIYQSLKADIEKINAMYDKEVARKEMVLKQAMLKLQQKVIIY